MSALSQSPRTVIAGYDGSGASRAAVEHARRRLGGAGLAGGAMMVAWARSAGV